MVGSPLLLLGPVPSVTGAEGVGHTVDNAAMVCYNDIELVIDNPREGRIGTTYVWTQ
jgi:hypothetical protein